MTQLITREECKKSGKYNSRVFTSAMPYKRFCWYCMEEIMEAKNE